MKQRAVNLLLRRKLCVEKVWCANPIVIENHLARLCWKISGCHKIIVQNFGTLGGDRNEVLIVLPNGAKQIELLFYGAGKPIKKSVSFNAVRVELLDSFDADSKMPQAAAALVSANDLINGFAELENNLPDWKNSFQDAVLKAEIPIVRFEFDSFKNHNQTS